MSLKEKKSLPSSFSSFLMSWSVSVDMGSSSEHVDKGNTLREWWNETEEPLSRWTSQSKGCTSVWGGLDEGGGGEENRENFHLV